MGRMHAPVQWCLLMRSGFEINVCAAVRLREVRDLTELHTHFGEGRHAQQRRSRGGMRCVMRMMMLRKRRLRRWNAVLGKQLRGIEYTQTERTEYDDDDVVGHVWLCP